jgi:antitoxin YefM
MRLRAIAGVSVYRGRQGVIRGIIGVSPIVIYFVTLVPGSHPAGRPGDFAMYTIYKLRADELDQRFLDTLKQQFRDRDIEIVVSEATERAEDETAYLLRSPANRERLLRALENVAEGRNLEVVDLGDLA